MSGPTGTKIPFDFDALAARSNYYGLLARMFRHPAAPGAGKAVLDLRPEMDRSAGALTFASKASMLQPTAALFGAAESEDMGEWTAEYEACFGATAHGAAPAYEIEYGEEHSFRHPQEMADIAAFYSAFGFRVTTDSHERVDHASVELEFAQLLIFKEALAIQSGDLEAASVTREAFVKFLSEHLARWMPSFLRRLARKAPQKGVLKGAADLAFDFLLVECAALGIAAGPKDLPLRPIEHKTETGCVSCLPQDRAAPG